MLSCFFYYVDHCQAGARAPIPLYGALIANAILAALRGAACKIVVQISPFPLSAAASCG
jgi:hypothetical protein